MALDINFYKQKLLEERATLEKELGHIAEQNPDNPADWEPKPEDIPQTTADAGEMADRLGEFGERQSAEINLEVRLNNVKHALERIEEGTYGICEVSKKPIPEERLQANPAATTIIA